MKTITISLVALLVGASLGYVSHSWTPDQSSEANAAKPLYWVAPMDPSYKRDKPGKSPMGMDLIPVYAEENTTTQNEPGTVTIDPAVVQNLGVKTTSVTLGHLTPRIDTVGYVGFDESRLWQLNLRVSGWVEKVNIHAIGESVTAGQTLFSLYSPELVNAQDELLNAHRLGRDALIKGAKDRLFALGMDNAQINQLLRSGKVQQSIDIKAQISGIVAALNVRDGSYLTPANTALSVGPIQNVWVDTEVFERQARWIKQGTKATLTVPAVPDKSWQGNVDYVYPIIDSKTRTLKVRLVFANNDGELKPNMFTNIVLQPEATEQALLIPTQSIIRTGDMTRVVLNEGQGKFRSARIEIGAEAAGMTQVKAGLKQGDSIVTSAQFLIDSESSLTAELDRINGSTKTQVQAQAQADTAQATGIVTQVMAGHRMLTIRHDPVASWGWPSMTMDFTLADDVPWQEVTVGQGIDFTLEKTPQGRYLIRSYQLSKPAAKETLWVKAKVTDVMAEMNMLTIEHAAVEQWQWPAGEMNFMTDPALDLSGLSEGDTIDVELVSQGGDVSLVDIRREGQGHD